MATQEAKSEIIKLIAGMSQKQFDILTRYAAVLRDNDIEAQRRIEHEIQEVGGNG
jgi:predicted CopG family antitoxin